MIRYIKSSSLVILLFISIAGCRKPGATYVPPPYVGPRDTTFSNPLLIGGPDPWVIQKDTNYYYTHTLGNRIALWRTGAMSKLGIATNQTVWAKPATGPNSQNVWAPELHYLDGKWYMYYTAGATTDQSTQRMFVLENTSADPMNTSWTDKGKIADPLADFFAIDATVLEYNSKRYLIWSGHPTAINNTQNLYIAQMSNPWTLTSARTLISTPQFPWEMFGSAVGGLPPVNEGPEVLKGPTGKTFLIYSASGCWTDDYALGMLTLRTGGDPLVAADWVKTATPVFVKNPSSGAYGPGHNAFFKSPDGREDWIIYHANPQAGQQCGDTRSPRIQKFTWNADGTPNFGTPVPINTPMPRPSGEKG